MTSKEINAIRQVADADSTETIINFSYDDKIINVYSNRATVMKRILHRGHQPTKIFRMDGEIEGMEFELPLKDMGEFVRVSIFKHG